MPLYIWQGLDQQGVHHQGKMFTRSYNDLDRQLLSQDIGLITAHTSLVSPRFSSHEKDQFFSHLASLLQAHIPLYQALNICSVHSSEKWSLLLDAVARDVFQGRTLSESLREYEFADQVCLALISVGESTGTLASVLTQYGEYRTFIATSKAQLRHAVLGPFITLIFFVLILCAVLVIIVPYLKNYFVTYKVPLPLMTQGLITLSDGLTQVSLWHLSALLVLILFILGIAKTEQGRWVIDYGEALVPFVRQVKKRAIQARVLKVLGMLTGQAVPLHDALKVCKELKRSYRYAQALARIEKAVGEGGSFSQAWMNSSLGCAESTALIEIGLSTGRLSDLLLQASKLKQKALEQSLHTVVTLINPLLVMVVAAAIGCVAFALYMPIISFSTSFGM